jgi:hypothetical protein
MSVADRMTVDRARDICHKHNVELNQSNWVVIHNRLSCAAGLYLVDKLGMEESDKFACDNVVYSGGITAGVAVIANKVGVPVDYMCGLNNGFELNTFYRSQIFDSEEYRLGVEDGKAIYNLMKEQEDG